MARASEALCRHYAQTGKLQIKVLHLPYLYGTESTSRDAGFARMFEQMQTGTVHFEEQAQDRVTALCMEDLAELVLRVFDTWTPEWETFTAPLAFSLDYEQLGEALKQLTSELRVTYGTDLPRAYPPDDGALRQRYGWFPRYRMLDDLPEMFGSWCERYQAKEKPAERLANAVQSHKRALRLAEILTAWVVTEGLVQMTGTQAQFRVVDFRLMFLVLVSTVYGLNAGVWRRRWRPSRWRWATGCRERRRCFCFTSRPTGWRSSSISLWARCAAMYSCAVPKRCGSCRRKAHFCRSGCSSCGGCIRTPWKTSASSAARSWGGGTALEKFTR